MKWRLPENKEIDKEDENDGSFEEASIAIVDISSRI
jgi:hypothetical protein